LNIQHATTRKLKAVMKVSKQLTKTTQRPQVAWTPLSKHCTVYRLKAEIRDAEQVVFLEPEGTGRQPWTEVAEATCLGRHEQQRPKKTRWWTKTMKLLLGDQIWLNRS